MRNICFLIYIKFRMLILLTAHLVNERNLISIFNQVFYLAPENTFVDLLMT